MVLHFKRNDNISIQPRLNQRKPIQQPRNENINRSNQQNTNQQRSYSPQRSMNQQQPQRTEKPRMR